jgi:hypothetical protein
MHFSQTFDLLKTFRRQKSPSDCRFRRLDGQVTAVAAPEIMEVDRFGRNPEQLRQIGKGRDGAVCCNS